jgi:rubrerythrin
MKRRPKNHPGNPLRRLLTATGLTSDNEASKRFFRFSRNGDAAMRLLVTLDEAIELEKKIQACYELLSRAARDGMAAELRQLARDEKSHVHVLLAGKNFVSRTPGAFDRETVSDAGIRLGIESAAGVEATLKSRRMMPCRALKKLFDLEKKCERIHINAAVEFKDYPLKKLFEALARADAEHRQRLDRLIARLDGWNGGYDDQVCGKKSFWKRARA